MCGIVGYVGDKDISSVLLVGLERLSYRGYDSSGISILSDGELSHWKRAGKIHELSNAIKNLSVQGNVGIGHTRWATHGIPDETNAHPQVSTRKKIAIVHNGIIENYTSIKKELSEEGVLFRSQTDTEVILRLIEKYSDSMTLVEAIERATQDLVGTYAIGVIAESEPETLIVARKGSPLIIGVGKNENYVSSDINAIVAHTKNMIYLDDGELAVITKEGVDVKVINGEPIEKEIQTIVWDPQAAEKSGYDHFMMKEIHEQPAVVRNILSKYVDESGINFKHLSRNNIKLEDINRFIIQACGTSWHSGLVAKYWIEQFAQVLTEVDISSEFRYRNIISQDNSVVVAISQSGETADTLACIREAKSKFFKVLSFVNVKNSTIDRESDGVVYSHAGQEVGVASTKNFIAQLVTFHLFTIFLSLIKGTITEEKADEMLQELNRIPDYIEHLVDQAEKVKEIADKYYLSREFLFIGRGVNYPSALEGALKLKEISYIHATGYAAGELKHGPIALIDSKLPVVCIAPKTETYEKMLSNIREVRSRKGKTIVIATEGDEAIKEHADDVIYIPNVSENLTPLLVAIPLQLLSYYIAIKLDCDVDQPRNLAKSVTVE